MSSEEPLRPSDVPPAPPSQPAERSAASGSPAPRTAAPKTAADRTRITRAAVIWSAVAVSLAVLVLLIIFFIQNQDMVAVRFLGWEGSLAQGVAFFIAAVGGGILVAIAGGARILQLRRNERRLGKRTEA
ncbi:LapA family protein [Pseudarthrobacter sulfonivorans]|uniref:LapA family protein n=1 Tax=Pseudarthrobacter sulfonivorans TaxID=121292 RepID=UPI00278834AB|nr:lipopolysaccharide assembly protein LapA domain-containing protein [Pseudarthrobacter sulfonivorans]MDQ0000035.1 putative integral membrane protein [Pseudarthrobacter sulfonivorans]